MKKTNIAVIRTSKKPQHTVQNILKQWIDARASGTKSTTIFSPLEWIEADI